MKAGCAIGVSSVIDACLLIESVNFLPLILNHLLILSNTIKRDP